MKAYVRHEMGVLGWMEKPDPVCGKDEAVCRPIALCPCSSDVHTAWEMDGAWLKDITLGHESIGEIVEVGEEVKDFKVGDKVIVPCTTPTYKHPDFQDTPDEDAGGQFQGICFSNYSDGTMAEKYVVRSADLNLCKLPEGLALDKAIMVTDMMTTGFHGAELCEVKFGDTVVVFGIGPVGLMAVAGAKLMGAGKLIAIGTRPNCVAIAKEYGATDIVSYKEGDICEQIMKLTDGRGADAAIVAGGSAETLGQAYSIVRCGGHMTNLNVITGVNEITFSYLQSAAGFMGHKTINGGLCPGGRRRAERLTSMILAGRVDPSRLVTHTFHGLDSIPEALQLMKDKPKDLIKPIVYID
ncbi:MAG: zinc-binding dehydrogenase [Lachnospiraceae bacterium]|nr:zinc-binding dehydrogenase [Lachnospiraceae bacterium]